MVDGTEKIVSLSEAEVRELQHAVRAQLDKFVVFGLRGSAAKKVNVRAARLESLLQKLCKSSA